MYRNPVTALANLYFFVHNKIYYQHPFDLINSPLYTYRGEGGGDLRELGRMLRFKIEV